MIDVQSFSDTPGLTNLTLPVGLVRIDHASKPED